MSMSQIWAFSCLLFIYKYDNCICWCQLSTDTCILIFINFLLHLKPIFKPPEGGSIIVAAILSVCPSRYLVRQITLKLLLPFKSNLVYR